MSLAVAARGNRARVAAMIESAASRFDGLYLSRAWGDGEGIPLSGAGSTVVNSAPVLEWIRRLNPSSVVDVGCGDMTWMVGALEEHHFNYTGIDVSREALLEGRANVARHGSSAGWPAFVVGDVTVKGFRVAGELVIVKDVLFHLDDEELAVALHNLSKCDYRWLVVNTDAWAEQPRAGREMSEQGHFAAADLEKEPFAGLFRRLGGIAERRHRPEHGEYVLFEK